jgi:heat shock protein HtpX
LTIGLSRLAVMPAMPRHNLEQSSLLVAGIAAILALATALLWGLPGVLVAFPVIGLLFLVGPRVPPEAVMRLYRARPAPAGAGGLAAIGATLAARADLPRPPALYFIPSLALNAFAVGTPQHSAIALTEGLLRKLSSREVAGVIAHETSHIKARDLVVLGIADVMTRFVVVLAQVAAVLAVLNLLAALVGEDPFAPWPAVIVLYLAPAATSLLQLALSRSREFEADAEAARLTGDPLGLAAALGHVDDGRGHLFEDLMPPVPVRRVVVPSLLRSHPPTAERIARLEALQPAPADRLAINDAPMMSLVGFGPGDMRPRLRWPGLWF